jgi:3-oxoacyl-[acyl-carrier-protein] synthase II
MEQQCKAFCLTLTAPRVAGLESLQVAARALAAGRGRVALAGATEAAIESADPAAGQAEAGAALLVLELRADAEARGGSVLGSCRTQAGFMPSSGSARAAIESRWSALGVNGVPVTFFTDDSAAADKLGQALRGMSDDVTTMPLMAGCVGPVWQVAAALAGGGDPGVVAVGGRSGQFVLTAFVPSGWS